jgi:hypothetical protein
MSFALRARIVWSDAPGRDGSPAGGIGLFRSGAEFVAISDDARAVLDTIVTRQHEPERPAPQKTNPSSGS